MIQPGETSSGISLLHFLPSLFVLIFFILFNLKFFLFSITAPEYDSFFNEYSYIYTGATLISVLHFSIYSILLFIKIVRLYIQKHTQNKQVLRVIILSNILIFIIEAMWFAGVVFYGTYNKWLLAFISVFIVWVYLLGTRHPLYLHIIRIEAERDRYMRSRVERLDVDLLIEQLNCLMENEKVFCYEDINLKQLASELDITHHQLSEILNNRLGKNFFTYINQYRIREAKELLLQEKERSIISIAHAVGYNSISAFYRAFQKFSNTSPTEFRNSN